MSQDKEREASIQWTLNGDKECGYNNWLGITPFGRILITWKGWKDYPSASVDEFPGELPPLFGSPDYVKQEAEREFMRRAALATQPPAVQGEPLPREKVLELAQQIPAGAELTAAKLKFARLIEAAHGIHSRGEGKS